MGTCPNDTQTQKIRELAIKPALLLSSVTFLLSMLQFECLYKNDNKPYGQSNDRTPELLINHNPYNDLGNIDYYNQN